MILCVLVYCVLSAAYGVIIKTMIILSSCPTAQYSVVIAAQAVPVKGLHARQPLQIA